MPKHLHKPFVTMGAEPVALARPWWATTTGKTTIAVVAGALAASAAGVVQTTRAAWSDGVEIVAEVGSGSLDIMVNGEQGNPTAVVLTMPPEANLLAPGKTVTTTMLLENAATLAADVTIDITGQGLSALGAQLDATLTASPEDAAVVTASGKANGLSSATFTVPAGETVPVTLDLVLPADTGNTWQNVTDELRVVYTAVQD